MRCSCCGEDCDPATLAALQCHDEIKVCRGCIGWLMTQAGGVDVTPILPVRDMDEAEAFYTAAGFHIHRYDGGFAFGHRGDQSVFDLDLVSVNPAMNWSGCFIVVPDVADWHSRLSAADLSVTGVRDEPWGMREFTLTDPSGNRLRIGQEIPETEDAP